MTNFEQAPDHSLRNRRVAIVHDWLPLYGGAERVLEQIIRVFPQADLFTIVESLPPHQRAFLQGKKPRTSYIQRLPFAAKCYRHYFLLMPLAVEQFDLTGYDIVISSSYAFAKGVITGPDQLHVCYCHSPIRYAWDLQNQYLAAKNPAIAAAARLLLHYIRLWDTRTANGVNAFVANSRYIARRIQKAYGKDAVVIHPPVALEQFPACSEKDEYYLTAARLVPYKRIDLIARAFARMPAKRLVIVGDGPEMPKVKRHATPNISLLGHQPPQKFRELMQRARGFIFAGEEDFGITLVEAQACGTPVIAFGRGGAREIVVPGTTGILFPEQTEAAIIDAIGAFEAQHFDPENLRRNAEQFSPEAFRCRFLATVQTEYRRLVGNF